MNYWIIYFNAIFKGIWRIFFYHLFIFCGKYFEVKFLLGHEVNCHWYSLALSAALCSLRKLLTLRHRVLSGLGLSYLTQFYNWHLVQNSDSVLARVTAAIKIYTLTKYCLVETSIFSNLMEINAMISMPGRRKRKKCRKQIPSNIDTAFLEITGKQYLCRFVLKPAYFVQNFTQKIWIRLNLIHYNARSRKDRALPVFSVW